MIHVNKVSRNYKYYEKNEGLLASFKSLVKREYKIKQAVKDISFDIHVGEIVGFIGLNGAGKTTTLKMLSGILKPTEGTIQVLSEDPFNKSKKFLQNISIVMGNKNQLNWDVPAIETIRLNKEIYSVSDTDYKNNLEQFSNILNVQSHLYTPVRMLSLGERMKLEIVAALIHAPKVIFLDEPTIGLDIISQKSIRTFLFDYRNKQNATIVITSHNMDDITDLCERIIVIDKGEIMYDGQLQLFIEQYSTTKNIKIKTQSSDDFEKLKKEFANIEIKDGYICILVNSDRVTSTTKQLLDTIMDIKDISVNDLELKNLISELLRVK